NEFSASRALDVVRALVADGSPAPSGSASNERRRDVLRSEFQRLGLDVALQTAVACNDLGNCGQMTNVVGRIPGGDRSSVVLVANYDTMRGDPGASADAVGAAVLVEVARALRAAGPLPHDILMLATDGELAGSLGAIAFKNHSPLAQDVRA